MSISLEQRKFGRLMTVRKARLMGASLAAIGIILVSGLASMILTAFQQGIAGMIVLLIGVVAGAVLLIARLSGRTAPERIGIRHSAMRRAAAGDNIVLAGPMSALGSARPQGLLAEMVGRNLITETGVRFSLSWFESTKTGAVSFDVIPSDKSGLPQSSIDALLDVWAALLVQTPEVHAPGLLTVVTDASITDGEQVRHEAFEQRRRLREVSEKPSPLDPDGEMMRARKAGIADAVAFVDELSSELATNTPSLKQRVTVSFVPSTRKSEDGREEATIDTAVAAALSAVPDFLAWLKQVGCRSVEAATIEDLSELTRCAFDPGMTAVFSQARIEGDPIKLSWDEAGPASSFAGVKAFEHEDYVSATLQMKGPPAQAFTEKAMLSLYKPDPVASVRRVTQFFTPFTAEESEALAGKATDRGATETETARKVRSKMTHEMHVAAINAQEITDKGSVMYRYAMTITVTCPDMESLNKAKANVIRHAKTGVKIGVRNTYRQTDTAFMLGLGLGLVPSRVASISDAVREAL